MSGSAVPEACRRGIAAGIAFALLVASPARADDGGASVWLPGQFASFAAVPGDPGFSLETMVFVRSASASASTSFPRGGNLLAGLALNEQYVYLTPTYTFATPVLAGQLSLGVTFSMGQSGASVFGTLTGPGGRSFAAAASDSAFGISDLYPIGSLKWQAGSHNAMVYVMGSLPTGPYDPNRLAGTGLGHAAIDWGFGYTYLPAGGFEISVTAGLTNNFVNPQTGYQSGVDGHIDLGTSWSFSETLYAGAVGYLYNQLSPDTGGAVRAGDFRSRVAGVGPQVGWSFVAGGVGVDVNLRGYKEFAAENRPEGWNAFLSVSLGRATRGRPE